MKKIYRGTVGRFALVDVKKERAAVKRQAERYCVLYQRESRAGIDERNRNIEFSSNERAELLSE